MKKIFIILAGVILCTSAFAQSTGFDVWSPLTWPSHPPVFANSPTTRTLQIHQSIESIPAYLAREVQSVLTIAETKVGFLSHYPNSNTATQALMAVTVPSNDSVQYELRFIASFKREVEMGYSSLAPQVPATRDRLAPNYSNNYGWDQNRALVDGTVREIIYPFIESCRTRALAIANLMGELETEDNASIATDVGFVRDSVRVDLNEINGVEFTAGKQNLYIQIEGSGSNYLFAPLRSVGLRSANRITRGTATQATCHIVAKGAAVYKVGSNSEVVLAGGTKRAFTDAEVGAGISVRGLDAPKVLSHVANQTTNVGDTQTVTYGTTTFSGEFVTYSVTSSQESVATVRLSLDSGILVITGVSAGNSSISLTATNAAGSAVTEFTVTVSP